MLGGLPLFFSQSAFAYPTALEWIKMKLLRLNLSIKETSITTAEKVSRRKLSLLDLAADLSNVSRASKLMGYSRLAKPPKQPGIKVLPGSPYAEK